jgi:hypothetical protein
MMPLIQFGRLREDQTKESRGQKEDLQATLAKMQRKKRWDIESSLVLQGGQRDSEGGIWKIAFNLTLEGRMSQAIFQRNKINLSLSLSFHNNFQELDSRGEKTVEILGLRKTSLRRTTSGLSSIFGGTICELEGTN